MKFDLYKHIFQKKNTEIKNFTKIRSEGAELLHADGMTEG